MSKHEAGPASYWVVSWGWWIISAVLVAFSLAGFFIPAQEGPEAGRMLGI